MRWQVEGADKVTGRERSYTIDADSPEKAEELAQLKGVLVSDVHEPGMTGVVPSAAPIDVHGPITTPPSPSHAAVPPPPAQAPAAVQQAVVSSKKLQHQQPPRYD